MLPPTSSYSPRPPQRAAQRAARHGWAVWLAIWVCAAAFSTTAFSPAAFAQPHDGWPYGLRLDDLVVHADFPLQDIQTELQELGELRQQLTGQLQHEIPVRPVHIYLFSDRATYHDYVRRQFPTAPLRPALFIGTPTDDFLLAAQGPDLLVDLRHELTHSLLHRTWPDLPLWLDEGLAEYFEHADASAHPAAERLTALAGGGQWPPADSLWAHDQPERLRAEDYALAYAWTRFLLESPAVDRAVLTRLLAGETTTQGPRTAGRAGRDRAVSGWSGASRPGGTGLPTGGLSAQLLRPLTGRCQQFWASPSRRPAATTASANYNIEGLRRP
ncbi:MAG: hypothetical protein U0795_08905 [Pirellulales bacterium]